MKIFTQLQLIVYCLLGYDGDETRTGLLVHGYDGKNGRDNCFVGPTLSFISIVSNKEKAGKDDDPRRHADTPCAECCFRVGRLESVGVCIIWETVFIICIWCRESLPHIVL